MPGARPLVYPEEESKGGEVPLRSSLFRFPRGPGAALLGGMVLLVAAAFLLGCVNASRPEAQLCPPVSLEDVVTAMKQGEKVVFVDVREPEEFAEYHLPGAVLLPSYQMTPESTAAFAGAKYVIPYCMKDFRGFEGGKHLTNLGVQNVSLIEGYGCNTWQKAKLPVAGAKPGKSDEQALAELLSGPGPQKPEPAAH